MNHPMDSGSDDEYEYEYHESETETFYLNLDLTSHHGPIRPTRRRQEDHASSHEAASAADENLDVNSSADTFPSLESADSDTLSSERIQILGLHTCNPIVSYYNQIFSCSWADQIGTELFFSHPETDPDTDHTLITPLQQGSSFELLAANSVKILGRKANITSSSGPALVQEGGITTSGIPAETPPSSQAASPAGLPRRATEPSYQAQFLQKLQNIKAGKGETDTVRTVMSTRRNVNITERLSAWARTESQMAEVEDLKGRAVNDDPEAIAALEKILRDLAQPEES